MKAIPEQRQGLREPWVCCPCPFPVRPHQGPQLELSSLVTSSNSYPTYNRTLPFQVLMNDINYFVF